MPRLFPRDSKGQREALAARLRDRALLAAPEVQERLRLLTTLLNDPHRALRRAMTPGEAAAVPRAALGPHEAEARPTVLLTLVGPPSQQHLGEAPRPPHLKPKRRAPSRWV